jgi:hypothetical protein
VSLDKVTSSLPVTEEGLQVPEQKAKQEEAAHSESELFALETEHNKVVSQLQSPSTAVRDMIAKIEQALQNRLFVAEKLALQEAQWSAQRVSREIQRVSQSTQDK